MVAINQVISEKPKESKIPIPEIQKNVEVYNFFSYDPIRPSFLLKQITSKWLYSLLDNAPNYNIILTHYRKVTQMD